MPEEIYVFHAGTRKDNGQIVTNGGRVLGVTALGSDIKKAIEKAYQGVEKFNLKVHIIVMILGLKHSYRSPYNVFFFDKHIIMFFA